LRDRPRHWAGTRTSAGDTARGARPRIRERPPRAGLEVFQRLGRIPAANDVQPLLHVALVFELGQHARARGLEEGVEVELIKLSGARDGHQFFRHLVGEQPHLW